MKTFSVQPGPSALLEYCKIRPGFEASFTIKPGLYAYLQCVWRLALCFDRRKKQKENWLELEYPSFLRNNMTSSNKCAKNVHVLYMYKYGPLRSLHGHGSWRLFFLEFSRCMYIFSRLPQIFRKPTVAIPGRNGGLFTWGIVRIFIPGSSSSCKT